MKGGAAEWKRDLGILAPEFDFEDVTPAEPSGSAVRVLLAEDHRLVRVAFARLIDAFDNVTVVGDVGSLDELLQCLERLRLDVVIVDGSLIPVNGSELIRELRSGECLGKVLITSTYASDGYIRRLVEAGACGFVHKNATVEELETAIHKAAAGREVVFSGLEPREHHGQEDDVQPARAETDPLTRRQREVLGLLAQGYRSRAIADRLNLSTKTIETHRTQIMRRLGQETAAGLVLEAIRLGLVPVPR